MAHLHCPTVTPLAQPRALAFVDVTHTEAARFHPALAAAQWAALKSARGQAVDLDRLTPGYLIGPAASPADGVTGDLDAAVARATPRIRAYIRSLLDGDGRGPDLGGAA